MDLSQRIKQFEKMAADDPENDMAHFSLGQAYLQAQRYAEAAGSFARCIAINRDMSKAYQLAGQAFVSASRPDDAAEVLLKGYVVAGERGDRMPQQAMGEMLTKLGKALPAVSAKPVAQQAAVPAGTFICRRTGRPGTKLDRPPFKGPIGAWIGENISKETFNAWIAQGTKVINELRLDLSRDQDNDTYDTHMREYLGIDDDLYTQLTGAPPAPKK